MRSFLESISNLINSVKMNKSLLKQLVKRNLQIRYKGTALGIVWSFAQPFILLVVYTLIFGVFFGSKWSDPIAVENIQNGTLSYAVIVFCGMTVYNIFSETITTSPDLYSKNPNYIKKVIFPLEILPIAQVISIMINNCIWFLIMFVGAVLFAGGLSWTMLFFPVILIPYTILMLGISYLLASIGVFFRDVAQICQLIAQILYVGTPIFYSSAIIPTNFRFFYRLNPITIFVEEMRATILFKQIPDLISLLVLTIVSLFILHFGYKCLEKTKGGFADVI